MECNVNTFNPFKTRDILIDDSNDPDNNFFNTCDLNETKVYSMSNIDELFVKSNLAKSHLYSVLHLNIRSMSKNFEKLKMFLKSSKNFFQVICLTETWCNNSRLENSFTLPNYVAFHQPRGNNKKKGGGICIFVRESLTCTVRKDLSVNNNDIEPMVIEISCKNKKKCLLMCNIDHHQEILMLIKLSYILL